MQLGRDFVRALAQITKERGLSPEVIASSQSYLDAGIQGLMFDPHISGFYIPSEQLPVVWDAVTSTHESD